MTDTALEQQLSIGAGTKLGHRRHAEPDSPMVHCEMKHNYLDRYEPHLGNVG